MAVTVDVSVMSEMVKISVMVVGVDMSLMSVMV